MKTPSDLGRRVYSSFDIDINPASLCSRIISVREQIAREFVGDLKAIATMGQQIFSSYYYNKNNTDSGKQSVGSTANGSNKPAAFYMNFDPLLDEAVAPSPLRKGNFDLLYNLITQEAVVNLLQNGFYIDDNQVLNDSCLRYLEKFYRERVLTHFVGAQFYWKGDDFIDEMMLASPIVMYDDMGNDEAETISLEIEPLRIAEQVLLRRDYLALEWLKIMEEIPSDHTEIRSMQLERMMGKSVVKQETNPVIISDEPFQ